MLSKVNKVIWEINQDFITYCVSSFFYKHDFSVITIFSNIAGNSLNLINLKSFQYYNMTWIMKFFEIYNHLKNIQVIYYNFFISLFTVITIISPLSHYYTCEEYEQQLLLVGNVIIKIFKNVVHIHKCKQNLGTGNLNTKSSNIGTTVKVCNCL